MAPKARPRRQAVCETIVGEIGYVSPHGSPVVQDGRSDLDLSSHLKPGSKAVVITDSHRDVNVLVVVRGNPDASKVEEAVKAALARKPGPRHPSWKRKMGDLAQAVTRGLWR